MPTTTEVLESPIASSSRGRLTQGITSILLTANLMSASAAVLVNIFAAAYMNQLTGKAAWAAAAIVVAYLPPLFMGPYLGAMIDRRLRRTGVLVAELGTAIATIGAGVAIALEAPMVVVLSVVGLRSLLVAGARNSLTRWLKLITPEHLQEGRMRLFILTILLALPASGMAMVWASAASDALAMRIVVVALVFHAAALVLIACLPAWPPQLAPTLGPPVRSDQALWDTIRAILSDRGLGLVFVACLFTQPVFQAAEQVLVSTKGSSLGAATMARMQTTGGVGLLLGFGLLKLLRGRQLGGFGTAAFVAAGLASLLAAARFNSEGLVLSAFLGMTLVYEFLDSYFFARFFAKSPPDSVARFSITVTNLGGTLMAVSAVGLGLAIDTLGFGMGTFVFVLTSIVYGLALVKLAGSFVSTR